MLVISRHMALEPLKDLRQLPLLAVEGVEDHRDEQARIRCKVTVRIEPLGWCSMH